MLARIDSYEWEQAFDQTPLFTRDDVTEIIAIDDGENDEDDWVFVGKLADGNYAYLEAGCCYTGWHCAAHGSGSIAPTLEGLMRDCVPQSAADRLGLNLRGEHYVKETKAPTSPEDRAEKMRVVAHIFEQARERLALVLDEGARDYVLAKLVRVQTDAVNAARFEP